MVVQVARATDQTAFGVGTADPRDTLQIVSTRGKPLPDFLDTVHAVPSVRRGVLLIVSLAEVREVAVKDDMELVAATGNVPFRRIVSAKAAVPT